MRSFSAHLIFYLPLFLIFSACSYQTDKELVFAAYKGNLNEVKRLVDKGANVNCIANDGWTPLTTASEYGHADVIDFLLNHGADINMPESGSNSALFWASHSGHLNVVKMLLERGAIMQSNRYFGDPLIAAVARNHLDVLDYLLKSGGNPSYSSKDGYTALSIAMENDNKQAIQIIQNHITN